MLAGGDLLKESASRGRGGSCLSKMAISQDVAAEAQTCGDRIMVDVRTWGSGFGRSQEPRHLVRGSLDRQIRNF